MNKYIYQSDNIMPSRCDYKPTFIVHKEKRKKPIKPGRLAVIKEKMLEEGMIIQNMEKAQGVPPMPFEEA